MAVHPDDIKLGRVIRIKNYLDAKLPEWRNYELLTVVKAISDDIKDLDEHLKEILVNEIGALLTIFNTKDYFYDWQLFEKVGLAVNGYIPHFASFEPLSIYQAAWAVRVLEEFFGPYNGKWHFADDVCLYIATIAYNDGLIFLAKPLDFAQEYLNKKIKIDQKELEELAKIFLSGTIPEDPFLAKQILENLAIQEYIAQRL